MFYSDSTMHKIYEDEGIFNFIYLLPKIIYSSIISSIINIIIKKLSLSDDKILELKKIKNIKDNDLSKIRKYLKIKFICFFLFSLIFLIFFWYYISCFCAVYINTQITLISDTFISYGLSMIYPFGLNLIPGIFRIPALRAKNKDKKCLYKISNILSLFL